MRRAALLLTMMAPPILVACGVAQAIINGQPDGDDQPYVGMVYNDEARCSGTLISPTVFLTAGHCTEFFEEGDSQVWVTFESRADFDPEDAYPGTPYTHPDYDGFFPDVGVVVLDEPVETVTEYGQLPEANLVETLRTGQPLTAVGYGVRGFDRGGGPPRPTRDDVVRYRATLKYLGTDGVDNAFGRDRFIKTREASAGRSGEGTCFGDSGGSYFLPDQRTIVAVTSYGLNPVCAGVGYVQRIDLPVVLNWINVILRSQEPGS